MEASKLIRDAMADVAGLRQAAKNQPELAQAVLDIKQLQAQRFAHTYADLLASAAYAPSATFFLQELYSAGDFSERDAQFSRIAGALERTFPEQVVATAVALAQLHGQTEALDMAMARHWCQHTADQAETRYLNAWRTVAQPSQRQWQLDTVLGIGKTLGDLTRRKSLRIMLKMMRQPARLAGLGSLQTFLETGFDRFASMATQGGCVDYFLDTVQARESAWLTQFFNAPAADCETELRAVLQTRF